MSEQQVVAKGTHGGPLLAIEGGFVELSVFETNVPPRFRLYFLDQSRKPAPVPSQLVEIETTRPDGRRQRFSFKRDKGFLESVDAIPEPHEFDLTLSVGDGGARRTYETRFVEDDHGHDHGDHGHGHGDHGHGHGHGGGGHGHQHGMIDPMIATTSRGLWAVKWSFIGLLITSVLQLVVVLLSNSIALMADMIHNFGDAATAIPLSIAFLFARRPASKQFTYGLGRVEDLAGLAVVLTITISAVVAGYEAFQRLIHPEPVTHLGAIIAASIIGFLGNEGVAIFRIKVGKEIGSAALIADGYHARTDGWTSLAVLVGAIGVYFGYPKADPIIGLLITIAIVGIVWQSVKLVLVRMLDGVEPEVIDQIGQIARKVPGVAGVTDTRARWLGHRMRAEVNITVKADLSLVDAHEIAVGVEHKLKHDLQFLSAAIVHVDPANHAGEADHKHEPGAHDESAPHKH